MCQFKDASRKELQAGVGEKKGPAILERGGRAKAAKQGRAIQAKKHMSDGNQVPSTGDSNAK